MRSGASGAGCLDASFAVSAMHARECRWYSALSIIAPSVNVLRRTRRKPSTIRGAAPDVVIGQSTAARAGAHLPAPAERLGPIISTVHTNDSTLTRNKGLLVSPLLELFLDRSVFLYVPCRQNVRPLSTE